MGVCVHKEDIKIEKDNKLKQNHFNFENNIENSYSCNEESKSIQIFQNLSIGPIIKTKRKNNSKPILQFLMKKTHNINS